MSHFSITAAWWHILKRDLILAFRRRAELMNPLLFFVLVVTLFPLAVGSNPNLLQSVAPGVIWVAALLAAMLSLDGIFRSDFEDGTLEQMFLSPCPVSVLVLAKVTAHWMVTGLPLLVITPLLGLLMNISSDAMGVLMLTLLIGTPILSLIGAIGVALTVALRRGGVILSLLVLPLYVPVLIFSTIAIDNATGGFPVVAQLSMLIALLVLALTLTPIATAAALRLSLG